MFGAGNPIIHMFGVSGIIRAAAVLTSIAWATRRQRFFGSTSQTTARAADRVETRLNELAKLGQLSNAMTVAEGCDKYWDQKMKHVRSAKDEATRFEVISTYLGPETLLVDITPAMVADAAARRERTPQRAYNRRSKQVELTKHRTSVATVNRQLVQPLRRFLKYARYTLGVPIDLSQFEWGSLHYEEAEDRNREIAPAEEIRYWDALRPDYHPIAELYLISGRRRSDWVSLTKTKVDLADGLVRVPSRKKKKPGELTVRLTPRELEIIAEEIAKVAGPLPVRLHVPGPTRRCQGRAVQAGRSHRDHAHRAQACALDSLQARRHLRLQNP